MLRSLILFLSEAKWAKRLVKDWSPARRVARRFVAGESLPEALEVARILEESGLVTTLAHLGERVSMREEADRSRDEILKPIQAIGASNLPSNISIKLTQLGLSLGYELCMTNLLEVAREGAAQGVYIRIDMEESAYIDQTLSLQHALAAKGLSKMGLVFQSALFRSENDVRSAVAGGNQRVDRQGGLPRIAVHRVPVQERCGR